MLNELETIGDVALVAPEQQPTALERGLLLDLLLVELRAKGNPAAKDAATLIRDGRSKTFQVETGVGLANVSRERAAILSMQIIREAIVEVVVPLRVLAESGVILQRSEVKGCACKTCEHANV